MYLDRDAKIKQSSMLSMMIKYVINATEARIRLEIEIGLEFNQSEERKFQKISSLMNLEFCLIIFQSNLNLNL